MLLCISGGSWCIAIRMKQIVQTRASYPINPISPGSDEQLSHTSISGRRVLGVYYITTISSITTFMALCTTSLRTFRLASRKIGFIPLSQARRSISTHENPVVCEESDVVIVGGGPAGLALASALGIYSKDRVNRPNGCAKVHLTLFESRCGSL